LADFQTAEKLSLTLRTIPTMPNYRGFHEITNFLKLHPEITIHLHESESNKLVSSLIDGKSHIIFARTFGPIEKA